MQGVVMKISIIGVGSVGGAVALSVYKLGLVHDLVLFDIDYARANAAADDLSHASVFGPDIKISVAKNYKNMESSEIVIIAAGGNQKIGQSRTDLSQANAKVMTEVMTKLLPHIDKKKTKIIIVTNPLDVMVMVAQSISKMRPENIIGTGTMLDTARFKFILSRYFGVSAHSVNACVLGEHGDTSVLNWSSVSIGNISLDDFCRGIKKSMTATDKKKIEESVRGAAAEIIRGRGATWDGIGEVVADLVKCILNDEQRILPVSVCDKTGFAMSLPRIVGASGVIATLNPSLVGDEKSALQKSAAIIKKNFLSVK